MSLTVYNPPNQEVAVIPNGANKATHAKITLIGNKSSGHVVYMECHEDFIGMLSTLLYENTGELLKNLKECSSGGTVKHSYGNLLNLHNKIGPVEYYQCKRGSECRSTSFSMMKGISCPGCSRPMDQTLSLYGGKPDLNYAISAGRVPWPEYIPGSLLILSNDLEVLPSSTASAVHATAKFKVKMAKLESLTINVGRADALQILRMANTTDKVLDAVFSAKFTADVKPGSFTGSLSRFKAKKPVRVSGMT